MFQYWHATCVMRSYDFYRGKVNSKNKDGDYIMFISFIIPCYNMEKYLRLCIDSLLGQNISANEFEIICINDVSSDDTLSILRQYENLNSNIVVLDQKNAGVCAARNAGLDRATGDYIWYIDADDCILPNCLSQLQEELIAKHADRAVIGNYRFPDGANPYVGTEHWGINTIWQDSSVCRNVFKRDFLIRHNLKFHYPELTYGEDALYMYEVKFKNPVTIIYNPPLYFYRDRSSSASHEKTMESKLRILQSNIIEAQVMKQYYESGRHDAMTADRFMSFLYGALYRIASLPKHMSALYLTQLKSQKLFPYKRPASCTITKSYLLGRNDWLQKIHDKIYINLNTFIGYQLMRCWNFTFRIKQHLARK